MNYADLHVHTNFSDGSFTPEEAVQHAKKLGLSAISITDHDITDGVEPAIIEGNKIGVEVIPGIELSVETGAYQKTEMHILGYFMNCKNEQFQETLKMFRNARQSRAWTILEKLAAAGVALDKTPFLEIAEKGSIGRLHFAKELLKEKFVNSIGEAFQRYLGPGKPAYVPKARLKSEEAIKMILRTGGIPVLAHPYIGNFDNGNTLKSLMQDGLQGMEVWHPRHPNGISKNYHELTKQLGLVATGGSDCHGVIIDGTVLMGKMKVSYDTVIELKKCKEKLDKENANIIQ